MTQTQKEIPFGRPWLDDEDRQAVMDILNGHVLTHGPKGKEFESKFQKFVGGGYAVTTSSCMASLHLSSINLKLAPGDEVIVPAQTHVATVHAVELVGATPVFVDCELETGNMDISLIEEKITAKTKAIFLVHFAGIPMDMDKVCQIANKHNLSIVEDCALAVGGYYKNKHVGLWGDMGCFSFYPVKHMTTAEGGMLISKDEKIAADIAHFRAFSVDRTYSERKVAGVYDVTGVGLNYRLSELQAALGCTQIDKLPENLRRRKENFATLKELLLNKGGVHVLDANHVDIQNSHYCLVGVLDKDIRHKRNDIIQYLTEHKAGCSVYYPHPVPRMKYYAEKYHPNLNEYLNAAIISDASIALPVGPHLGIEEMHQLAHLFEKAIS